MHEQTHEQENATAAHNAVQHKSDSGAESPIVVANNVVKIYGTDTVTVRALDNVSLAIKTGEIIAIMGPSGSGEDDVVELFGRARHHRRWVNRCCQTRFVHVQ